MLRSDRARVPELAWAKRLRPDGRRGSGAGRLREVAVAARQEGICDGAGSDSHQQCSRVAPAASTRTPARLLDQRLELILVRPSGWRCDRRRYAPHAAMMMLV